MFKKNREDQYRYKSLYRFIGVLRIHKAGELLKHIKDKAKCIFYDVRYFTSDILQKTFSKNISPMATSQVTISQVATSQIWNFPSGNFPKVWWGLLRLGGRALRQGQIWEVTAWENDFGKVPKDFLTGLGEILKMGLKELSLGKNIWFSNLYILAIKCRRP